MTACRVVVLVAFIFGSSANADAQTSSASASFDGEVRIGVEELIRHMADVHGMRFMLNRDLDDRSFTIIGPQAASPMSPKFSIPVAAFPGIGRSMLRRSGLILTPLEAESPDLHAWWSVVDAADVANLAQLEMPFTPETFAHYAGEEEALVTLVLTLAHADASDVRAALGALYGNSGGTTIRAGTTQTLVMVDYAFRMRTLLRIIKLIDTPRRSLHMEIIPLQHLAAAQAYESVEAILAIQRRLMLRTKSDRESEPQAKVVTTPNLKGLVVFGDDAGIEGVRAIVSELDVISPLLESGLDDDSASISVYRVRNAEAQSIASALEAFVAQHVFDRVARLASPLHTYGDMPEALQARVVADTNSNSLIISATPAARRRIMDFVLELDARPPQLLVDMTVLDLQYLTKTQIPVGMTVRAGDELALSLGTTFGDTDATPTNGIHRASTGISPFSIPTTLLIGPEGGTQARFGGDIESLFGIADILRNLGLPVDDIRRSQDTGVLPPNPSGGAYASLQAGETFGATVSLLKQSYEAMTLVNMTMAMNDGKAFAFSSRTLVPYVQTLREELGTSTQVAYASEGIDAQLRPRIMDGDIVDIELDLMLETFSRSGNSPPGIPPGSTRLPVNDRLRIPAGATGVLSRHNTLIVIRPYIVRDRDFSALRTASHQMLEQAAQDRCLTADGERAPQAPHDLIHGWRRAQQAEERTHRYFRTTPHMAIERLP